MAYPCWWQILPFCVQQMSLAHGDEGHWSGQGWFQFEWVEPISSYNITFQEFLPIVLAAAVWKGPYSESKM